MAERELDPATDAIVRKVVTWGLGIIFLAVCASVAIVLVVATLHTVT